MGITDRKADNVTDMIQTSEIEVTDDDLHKYVSVYCDSTMYTVYISVLHGY